jgi:hypothetical protein
MKYNEYMKSLHILNVPDKVTRFTTNGMLRMFRDGQLIETQEELEQYQAYEKEFPNDKHWFNFEFIPFNELDIKVLFEKGRPHFDVNKKSNV